MGDCKLCGEKASFLRRVHSKCNSIRESGLQEMTEMATRFDLVACLLNRPEVQPIT